MRALDDIERTIEDQAKPLQRQALSAIIGPSGGRKRAHEAATMLENELFARGLPSGAFLGTSLEFRRRFHLGYRASDEAVTILKNRGLIEVRRGLGGGLYVTESAVDEIAERLVIHLSLSGALFGCVMEARLLAWQMIVDALLRANLSLPPAPAQLDSRQALFAWLARQTDNAAMQLIVELIEATYSRCVTGLAHARQDMPAPLAVRTELTCRELIEAIHTSNSANAQALCVELAKQCMPFDSSIATASLSVLCDAATLGRGDQASNGLAARLMHEINDQQLGRASCRLESEEQIGERFGVNVEIVRRALRMLEDMGLVECQQGRRGALLRSNPQDGAVVRIICASLIAHGVPATNISELVSFIGVSMNALAAQRVRDGKLSSATLRSAYVEQPGLGIAEQMQFENFMTELAGNPILSMLLRAISLRYLFSERCVHRGHYPDYIRAAITDCNWRILDAIVAGDVEAAKQFTRQKNEIMRTPA